MANSHSLNIAFTSMPDFWDRFQRLSIALKSGPAEMSCTSITGQAVFNPQSPAKPFDPESVDELNGLKPQWLRTVSCNFGPANNKKGSFTFQFDRFTGHSLPVVFQTHANVHLSDIQVLSEHFTVLTDTEIDLSKLEPIAKAQVSAHQSAVSKMEATVAQMLETQAKSITDSSAFIKKHTVELVESQRKREEEFAEFKRKSEQEISDERVEVEKRLSELNLRESKGVRRELLKKMEELVAKQSEFERSKETKGSDLAVWIVGCIFGLLGASAAGVSLALLSAGKASGPTFYSPFAAGSLLLASTAVVLIRHVLIRARRHTEIDLSIMQYSRDMYRMSWITELLFEAKANAGVEGKTDPVTIPELLLSQFSHSLFESPKERESAHPLDDLQRYLKRFKKFSIGAQGVGIEAEDAKLK